MTCHLCNDSLLTRAGAKAHSVVYFRCDCVRDNIFKNAILLHRMYTVLFRCMFKPKASKWRAALAHSFLRCKKTKNKCRSKRQISFFAEIEYNIHNHNHGQTQSALPAQ